MEFDYNIREYEPGDEEQIASLLKLVFDEWPSFNINCNKVDFWKWKYLDNPLRKTAILVAEHDEKIIACNHGLYKEIKICEKIFNFQIGADLAVHPDFRRRGLFKSMSPLKIQVWERNETDLGMMATVNPIVKKHRVKSGNQSFPQGLLEMLYISDPSQEDLSLLKRTGYRILQTLNKIKPIYNQFDTSDVSVEIIEEFGKEADVLWDKVSPNYLFAIKRDKRYLNWRYLDARSGSFDVYAAYSNHQLLGYCVTRVKRFKDSAPSGLIVDILTYPDRLDIASRLVEKAMEGFMEDSVNRIRYLGVKGHPYEKTLNGFGFLSRPAFFDISYKIISGRVKESVICFESAPSNKLLLQYGESPA